MYHPKQAVVTVAFGDVNPVIEARYWLQARRKNAAVAWLVGANGTGNEYGRCLDLPV